MIISNVRLQLQRLSSEYYARLQVIETKAHAFIEYSQAGAHMTFTPHGVSHISAVEKNYNWLIPEADLERFNSPELFILICATFFHDAFMIPRRRGNENESREQHAVRAREFLLLHREGLGLDIHEVDAIGETIRAHGVTDIGEINERVVIGNSVVDLRKIGACLSLADICHADASRAPEIVFRHLELDAESRFHWRRHMQISGITRQDDAILMSSLSFSDSGRVAVNEFRDAVELQLKVVAPYFKSILQPINRVELIDRRLESPLDQTFQFQTNTPAILKLLIEGVYDRGDVFVRELVQNSLDSCLVRRAKQQRRNAPYHPEIVLTIYSEKGNCKAFRVDDNGVGMDLSDIQDTVLWIGSSISSREDISNLLNQTLGKNLIATFGIGMLSCFKASNNIRIRTHKENETALNIELTGVLESVRPEKGSETSVGTSIIVDISGSTSGDINLREAIAFYFRMVRQVNLQVVELDWTPDLLELPREDIFRMALTEASDIPNEPYFNSNDDMPLLELLGDDFSGAVWMPVMQPDRYCNRQGNVDILNEGVFVSSEPIEDWFPVHLSACDAVLNFSSKSISLPAGRDRVIRDTNFRSRVKEVSEKSYSLVDSIVATTASSVGDGRDNAALLLAFMFMKADKEGRAKLVKRLGSHAVRIFRSNETMSLAEIAKKTKKHVFLHYLKGTFVSKLGTIDGKQLYHKEDDFVELQAALLKQEGELVLSTARADGSVTILESDMLQEYLKEHGTKVVDLFKANVISGKGGSKPINKTIRQTVGPSVKFVEVAGIPNRKSWRVGDELWINLANSQMRKVYDAVQAKPFATAQFASVLFKILSYQFDEAIDEISLAIQADQ